MPRKSKNLSYLDIAGVFLSAASMLNGFTNWLNGLSGKSPAAIHNRQILAINDQRLTNLQLDAQLKHQRTAKISNDVTTSDAAAELALEERRVKLEQQKLNNELKRLKVLALEKKLGITSENFTASAYDEPGDVRRGKMYE